MSRILVIGNKQCDVNLDHIIDSFDIIYRCNLAWPGKNNGAKFGKLAMCCHVYDNFIRNPKSKHQILNIYSTDYTSEYLNAWYDFFQENRDKFDEIYHQDEHKWGKWNNMLESYNSPYKFSRMATTGYSTIFEAMVDSSNEVHVAGFTLDKDELRASMGVLDSITKKENDGGGVHSFGDEINILNWLHTNKKVDATLCEVKQ